MRAASSASTAPSQTWACRPISSKRRDEGSAFSARIRSTCAWTRRAARRPPISCRDASESEIADAIYQFGEERFSRRIARSIVQARADGAAGDDVSAGRRL